MNNHFTVTQIGVICADESGFALKLAPQYTNALAGLEGFSHLQVLWWFSGCDNPADRGSLTEKRPYTHGPEVLGAFATRSPQRPNPIALSCAGITFLDAENGVIGLDYIDAQDQTPLLDLKPYTPSLDRVEQPKTPAWCSHWPANVETSGAFDWECEFNF